jgi:hypothetical protein
MKKRCTHCIGQEYRRLNRQGFWERKFLTLFGLYPWECALCRHKTFLRNKGHHAASSTVNQ